MTETAMVHFVDHGFWDTLLKLGGGKSAQAPTSQPCPASEAGSADELVRERGMCPEGVFYVDSGHRSRQPFSD